MPIEKPQEHSECHYSAAHLEASDEEGSSCLIQGDLPVLLCPAQTSLASQGFSSSDAFPLSLGPGSKTQQAVSRISSTQAFQLYNPIVFISWLILFRLNGLPVGHSFQG